MKRKVKKAVKEGPGHMSGEPPMAVHKPGKAKRIARIAKMEKHNRSV